MFFLGISAPLLVYLLVPAFLIVCFYCRDIQGTPEIPTSFPVVLAYEHTVTVHPTDTYVYQSVVTAEKEHGSEPFIFTDILSSFQTVFYRECLFPRCLTTLDILRAPPCLFAHAGN